MVRYIFVIIFVCIVKEELVKGCLITNCPRGGKRSGKFNVGETNIKQCISCGPIRTGQCFGPNICCGPFGCLMGTSDTLRCLKEGQFHENEPCLAGNSSCRRNTGRCAADGICCSQDSCYVDKSCSSEEKNHEISPSLDLYTLLGYQSLPEYGNK